MSGFCKYYKQKKQVSYDNGVTWQDVTPYEYQEGDLYERNSTDCGYQVIERWVVVSGDYECSGTTKYTKEQKEISYDGGQTWTQTSDYRRGNTVIEYNSEDCGYVPPTGYSAQYLTFVALESGSFGASTSHYYSLDDGLTWDRGSRTPIVKAGQKVMWKNYIGEGYLSGGEQFSSTNRFTVEGNIMSLVYGDDFVGQTSIVGRSKLFLNSFLFCSGLISAENLVLPATTLSSWCYMGMFDGCTNLTTAPKSLPATTLTENCYCGMFQGCTSLTTAPSTLPATTLARNCYGGMFQGCTSLTTAPEIFATTLAKECCGGMFEGCTSLTTAPSILPATSLAVDCYRRMFQNCTSLTTAPELPATTLAKSCCMWMFENCTSLTTAPELPATTLAENCYRAMFEHCTSLTTAPSILPATALVNYCYDEMFDGCTSLTTAPELPATTLVDNCYQYMFYNCTSLSSIKCLATNISADNCTTFWLSGVASSGTFTKPASMTSWTNGPSDIPNGWTVVNV